AVAMMKAGAHDCLQKGRLARLAPAVERELQNVAIRRERQQAEQALHVSQTSLAAMQRIAQLGSWELDLSDLDDLNKNALRWSGETFRIFGWEPGQIEVSTNNFFRAAHPDDKEKIVNAITRAIKEGAPCNIEHRIVRPDGSERIVQEMANIEYDFATGKPLKMIGTVQDITNRRRYEIEIEHLASHDALTDLPNRNLLNDRLAQLIARATRVDERIAVLFLDLDRFKFINDSFGHGFGDTLLKEVAQRLRESVRDYDTVARLGGDEFVVVLHDFSRDENISEIARKLLKAISRPFIIDEQTLHVTASIGVSVYPDDGFSGNTLLRNADTAMYRAKERGRDALEFYTRQMSLEARERVQLESALWRAVEQQEFELYFQPQVSLWTGEINGVEALIRWRHPEQGLVAPDRFIPLAEDTGVIIPMEEWVLKTACAQAVAWRRSGHSKLSVAVNFSTRHFHQPNFVQFVESVLQETGLDAEYLDIELTERTLMQNSDAIALTMRRLKRLGVRLSLDDFGTGYSSLSYLKRFPINILKIDKTFIDDISLNSEDAAIVRAIIDMARSLAMRVVAEGVEREEQLDFLMMNQCDGVQGYYISPPVTATALTALLDSGRRLDLDVTHREQKRHTLEFVPGTDQWQIRVAR
ncbi:MAG TPA: EAL domain-containing protein, partial [Burkholderiales bacterium]|nr:EAL domain-containing protein [Burkholderiales bacterium]